jgi:hypothetical protein
MQKHFCLVKDVSLESANIVFDKTAQKEIKDAVKHTCLVSTTLHYSQVLYHLLYLMTIFYLITTFVVLLAGVEVADKATSGVRHLPNQGAAALRKG